MTPRKAPTTLRCRLFGHKWRREGVLRTCQRRKCTHAELPAALEANKGVM